MRDGVARVGMQLTRQERGHLYWACLANGSGMGLFGPSIRQYGGGSETCDALVAKGLLKEQDGPSFGYWLTDAGRDALRKSNEN